VRRKQESGATDQFTAQFFFPDELTDEIMKLEPYNRRGRRDTFNKNDGVLHESDGEEGMIMYPIMKSLAGKNAGYKAPSTWRGLQQGAPPRSWPRTRIRTRPRWSRLRSSAATSAAVEAAIIRVRRFCGNDDTDPNR